MGAKWSGGAVDGRDGGDPPTVEEWRPVTADERRTEIGADEAVAYRTTFPDPRDDEAERGWLELVGGAVRADVRLNGAHVGTLEPYVGSVRTAFDPRPENELLVVGERSDGRETAGEREGGDVEWETTIESRPRTFLRSLEARPKLTEEGGVIDVTLEVDADETIDGSISLTVLPEGFRGSATMQRVSVSADAGERVTISKSLEIREPALWWPARYGPPHRYAVRAKLNGDVRSRTVGFRTVERDDDGLLVNGRRVRVRGFRRPSGGDPVEDVGRAGEANATLVRASAGEPPAFYDACDEHGILVWQDLPTNEGESADAADRVRTLASALERTYGHHPSLAIFGVADDPSGSNTPYDGLHGDGFLSRLRFRYRSWRATVDYESTETVADALPGSVPVVSSAGPPGTGADATTISAGWAYLEAGSTEWLLETDPDAGAIVGGIEAGSLAADDVDPVDVPDLDASTLERRIGPDADAETSQAYQARTLKTVVETLRRRGCGVLATAPLRDATPGGGAGVLTRTGDEKPAYRALARSFEPVQAVLDGPPASGTVGITLCNDTHRDLEATVGWQAGDASGETTVSVGSLETAGAGTAEVPDSASRIELTVDGLGRPIVNEYRL